MTKEQIAGSGNICQGFLPGVLTMCAKQIACHFHLLGVQPFSSVSYTAVINQLGKLG